MFENVSQDDMGGQTLERLDALCDEFEAQRKSGAKPELEKYLNRAPDCEPRRLFQLLLQAELACRRAAREQPAAEDYQARFPAYRELIQQAFQDRTSPPRAPAGKTTSRRPAHPERPAWMSRCPIRSAVIA